MSDKTDTKLHIVGESERAPMSAPLTQAGITDTPDNIVDGTKIFDKAKMKSEIEGIFKTLERLENELISLCTNPNLSDEANNNGTSFVKNFFSSYKVGVLLIQALPKEKIEKKDS